MKLLNLQVITLNAAGQTVTLDSADYIDNVQYSAVVLKGSGSLSGNIAVTYSNTPLEGTLYTVYYNANFVLGSNTITIFGKVLNQQEAASGFKLEALYENGSFKVKIFIDESVLPNGYNGYRETAVLAAGATITLYPRLDKKKQRFTGSAVALLAGYTVTADTATALEGDDFWIDFDATIVLGAQTLTVMGNAITVAQALVGGFSVYTYYSGSVWYSQVILPPSSSTSGVFNSINAVYVDGTYGLDSTGTAQRVDLPFKTIAAARTAAVALAPTATSRASIIAKGYFAEGYIGANYCDLYNGGGLILERTSGNTLATIDDNNAAVDFNVYGYPKLIRSGTGTTPVGNLIIRNASSRCTAYVNPNDCTTTGTSDTTIGLTNGTLTVYCEDVNNSGALTNTDATVLGCSAGTLTVYAKNLSCTSNVIGMSGGTGYFYINNITGSGTGADSPISLTGSSTAYIEFNDMTYASTANGAIRLDDTADANVLCKGKITAQGYVLHTLATHSGSLRFRGRGESVTTEAANILGSGAIEIEGRLLATGANKDCIIVGTSSTLYIKDLEMVTNGTGKCMIASAGVDVYNYGGCVATVAADPFISELVDATIIDSNVI